MIDIEKLKKEIKGRIRKNVYLDYHEGYNDALKRTISIIESMEEESVSEDLEKEIINYIGFPQEVDEDISTTMMRKAARHFANWQKEQMMKDAVEGTVEEPEYLLWRIISDDLEGLFVVNNNLHDGDRVKIIIIKMD
jgi:hypothetical protein